MYALAAKTGAALRAAAAAAAAAAGGEAGAGQRGVCRQQATLLAGAVRLAQRGLSYKPREQPEMGASWRPKGFQRAKGRDNKGRISAWHRGGGHKRRWRPIDFHRTATAGVVESIEYDPNRSANIARVFNPDSQLRGYILAPQGLKEGDVVRSIHGADIKVGHTLRVGSIPPGFFVHNIAPLEGQHGKYCRAAGTYGQVSQERATESGTGNPR